MKIVPLSNYDGQSIYVNGKRKYSLGNYLGGGASGNVYEAVEIDTNRNFAVKILHPVGFKLCRPSLLAKYTLGVISNTSELRYHDEIETYEDIEKKPPQGYDLHWLIHPNKKVVIAAYKDNGVLRELPLSKCFEIWGDDIEQLESMNAESQATVNLPFKSSPFGNWKTGGSAESTVFDSQERNDQSEDMAKPENEVNIPYVPQKYIEFLKARREICKEIFAMSKVCGHENVLQLFKVMELIQDSKSTLFLVLEIANSGELFDRIRIDEGCDEETACTYFRQVLAGVAYCHVRGVCHRDLKPENLLLAEDPNGFTTVKIADFGLSALLNTVNQYRSFQDPEDCSDINQQIDVSKLGFPMKRLMSVVGSPHYVAPEILEGASSGYDGAKADVWSLGVILYAMLAGNLPFSKDLLQCARFGEYKRWRQALSERTSNSSITKAFYRIPRNTRVPYPSWFFPDHLSEAVKTLLIALLDPSPPSRINVEEAKQHLWVSVGHAALEEHFHVQHSLYGDAELYPHKPNSHLVQDTVDSDSEVDEDEATVNQRHHDFPLSSGSYSERIRNPELNNEGNKPSLRQITRNTFNSPPLAPMKIKTERIPPLVLGPSSKTPMSRKTFERVARRKQHRSLSPPRRRKSNDVASSKPIQGVGSNKGEKSANDLPVFTDIVKRSTRFSTVVPASEVLERIAHIVENNSSDTMTSCVKLEAIIDWDLYSLDILRGSILLCTVRIFLLKANLYMVEFIRGQISIFEFKQLYEDIHVKLGEIVKNDYTLNMLDA